MRVHVRSESVFSFTGIRIWLVQVRPITARGRNTYPELHGQPEIWTRGNTCEVTP